ncbi:MAG: hypothetical protein HFG49_04655 [Lachnospiraceae bacterium]|jgi:hypothetical protein|nr:hypothetical protein [Lachnospiraceae bacterium]
MKGTEKKTNRKILLMFIGFVVMLFLTIVFNGIAGKQDKESLGTKVSVRVTDIKVRAGGLRAGSLSVTVSYKGEEYKLKGVPSGQHFQMKSSKNFRTPVSAILYNGKLYYDATSIMLVADQIYYIFLMTTFVLLVLICGHYMGAIKIE